MSLDQITKTNSLFQNRKFWFFIFLPLCIALGFYFRVKGLSNGGFANSDEYYIAKSVHNILEYGVPKYPLGGYYNRGLIYQYLSALLVLTGIKEVFALRIIPLIFNILAIPAIYLLAKKIGGKALIVSIIFLFCFSIIEIEYSRVARYYAPFQMLFLWYIYFLYKTTIESDHQSFKWMILLSITSVFMYEGSIFLVVLNFVPFILSKEKISPSKLFYAIIIFIAAFLYLRFDFRNYGVTDFLPTDIQLLKEKSLAPIDIPHIFIQTFPSISWYLLLLIPLAAIVFYGFYVLKKPDEKKISFIFLFLALLSLFNLYGIILVSSITFFLVGWIKLEHLKNKSFYFLILILFLNFIFYLIYGLTTQSWLKFFPEESYISVNKIFWVFINYPNFYEKIILPWLQPMPKFILICVLFTIGYFVILFYKSKNRGKEAYSKANFLLSVIIFLVSLVAILKTPYNDTRYTFFIYPLILLLLLFFMQTIGEFITRNRKFAYTIFFIFLILFILLSSDYSFNHLLKIDSNEIRFRTIYEPKRNIYYYQEDYVTPAEFINKNMKDNDIVMTNNASLTIEYYLKRLDYIYINYQDSEFTGRSRSKGTKEIWTNANLIYKEEKFLDMLNNSKSTIWLGNFSNKRPGVSPEEKKINKEFSRYLYYVNLDSTINVYKIPSNNK
ncbi:MAG: hypothetical protein A2057_04755 [Ignavibacteria bacterium GWA2_35_9]|nr:MAG: hypothetical protein A2057_04755 [Ignavibacteria bacterium GWA2_35_9]OGU48742.1 MAG: hypothetical protein A2080_05870 [Ignavibacteria bacterium GWC2_36_12]